MRMPLGRRRSSSKSAIEGKRRLGVLYHSNWYGPAALRRAALLGQHPPQLAVGEVGEADDGGAAHAQHLVDDALGVDDRLQRLRQHDDVELAVGERRQPCLRSPCTTSRPRSTQARTAARRARRRPAASWPRCAQPSEQPAVAAAEVEHAGAGGDQLEDDVVVEPLAVEDAGGLRRARPPRRHAGRRRRRRRAPRKPRTISP